MHPIPPSYRDKHAGEVCVVLGNGPSIRNYDLSDPFFKENVTLGSNAIGKVFKPTYYFFSDPQVLSLFSQYLLSCAHHSVFFVGSWLIPKLRGEIVRELAPIQPVHYSFADHAGPPDGKIFHGRTAGCILVHMAYLMGFKYVFLLGMDGYSNRGGDGWFYGKGEGLKWANENDAVNSDIVSARHLTATADFFVKNGRFLYDLSDRSNYEMIPKYWEKKHGNSIPEQAVQGNSAASQAAVREE